MQYLVLLRGAPGSGKSTFIKEHGLEPYTLSSDQIRLQYASPYMDFEGGRTITQNYDKVVWNTLYDMLENRMKLGCFTVIDATHYKSSLISPYKKLVQRYGYRTFIVDFTDVPYDVLLKRNNEREDYKRVPVQVIDKMVKCFKNNDTEVQTWCTTIKPEQFDRTFVQFPVNLTNDYDDVFVFGDIHGCYTCFKNFIDKHPLTDRTMYIFVGDYLDRGLENDKMLQWLLDNYKKPNVKLLKSNHTKHLTAYAYDGLDAVKSKEFKNGTYPQIKDFNVKDIKQLCRKFIQMSYFQYGEKQFIVTHGGIPYFNAAEIYKVPTVQFVRGVGDYENGPEIDENFSKNVKYDWVYSIHGHRNVLNEGIHNTKNTYNLDSPIEYGAHLRILGINKDGITEYQEPNPIFKEVDVQNEFTELANAMEIMPLLQSSKDIIKKDLGDGYFSFNFSRDVFRKKTWNELSKVARGLFVHVPTNTIVARSYPKFFNYEEREETKLSTLVSNYELPIKVYHKYNGFLGILSYDFINDDFFIATKSTNSGPFKDYFKQILLDRKLLDDNLKQYLKENNCTMVFEVIDPINDPHIVEYEYQTVILLDVIKNEWQFKKLPYNELIKVANNFGMEVKQLAMTIDYNTDLDKFLKLFSVLSNNILFEGYVIEDSKGRMFKLKTEWYKFWKEMRNLKFQIEKGQTPNKSYTNAEWINFYRFLQNLPKEELSKDIITLRNKYNKSQMTMEDYCNN